MEANIPYSTVDNLFKRGIMGAGVQTVFRICDALQIDINALINGEIVSSTSQAVTPESDENIKKYLLLNEEGKKRVGQLIDDLSALPKYQIRDENGLTADQRCRFSDGMDELAQAVENICEDSENTGSLLFGLSHGKK